MEILVIAAGTISIAANLFALRIRAPRSSRTGAIVSTLVTIVTVLSVVLARWRPELLDRLIPLLVTALAAGFLYPMIRGWRALGEVRARSRTEDARLKARLSP